MSTQHTGLGLAEKVKRWNYTNKTHENPSIVRTLFDLLIHMPFPIRDPVHKLNKNSCLLNINPLLKLYSTNNNCGCHQNLTKIDALLMALKRWMGLMPL